MEQPRRRRRPAVSCTLCRKRKIRCNREWPCNHCMRSRRGECVYVNPHPGPSSKTAKPIQPLVTDTGDDFNGAPLPTPEDHVVLPSGMATASSSTGVPTPLSQSSSQELESLKNKVRQLEDQLSATTVSPSQLTPTSNVETSISHLGGTFHMHSQGRPSGPLTIPRAVSHKTRFFGQSHIFCGMPLLMDVIQATDPYSTESSDLIVGVQKCKAMARRIKAQRAPEWPTPLTTELVSKAISDDLVQRYLNTVEKIYRILHVPTFMKKYDAIWTTDSEPDRDFVAQLKLVHALGATTYDDKFSLRPSAIRWVYEVQTWISEPEFKSRLNIQFVQTNILLLLARDSISVGGETFWIACGSLPRIAMSMGLHRDPALLPKTTTLVCEMRRRLWNTILELCLHSSLQSGGAPMILMDQFDTKPPGNFDDDQLMVENTIPRPDNVFTEMSTSRALRKSFPARLKVVQLLNDLKPSDCYPDTLRLDSQLKTSYKEASHMLKTCQKGQLSPSDLELCAVDFIMRRYLCALHFPYYGLSLQEPRYAFSRQMSVETAFKIWATVSPAAVSADTSEGRKQFARFINCTAGFFRIAAWQASMVLMLELRNEAREDDGLSPLPCRQDLVNVMDDSISWNVMCIEAGETNMKGHLVHSMLIAQIKGIMRHLSETEVIEGMVKAGEEAGRESLAIYESLLAQLQPEGVEPQELPGMDFTFGESWDFTMVESFLDGGEADPMSWLF
ncbi:hypothetical protein F53441_6516 [Fusarium austroafricanum]|uniref:Zn(2)-C6 fungal-type domain-containing protein n=1 Tax=Fusarium austroafricanum TaxID=2364996 RepID=A0A8H4P702_9HYPO|nr:hypothetical protein F53441_6516 [Fusarium austroafricanum]